MKKHFKISIAVCILASLFVSPAFARQQLTFSGSQAGGTWFILCGALAQIVNKYMPGYEATPTPSSGAFENVRNLRDGVIDFAMMMPNVANAARTGTHPWVDEKYEGMRALFNAYTSPFMLITMETSDVHTVTDLINKRVATGSPGSSEASIFEIILPHYEMNINESFRRLPLSDVENSAAIVDGQVDAGIFITAVASPTIRELTTTHNVRFISIDPEVLAKVESEYPYFVKGEIPANTFRNQPEPVVTVVVWGQFVATEETDEDLVYEFMTAVFDNRAEIDEFIHLFREMNNDNVTDGMAVPLHPGAIRFYTERGIAF